MDDAYPCRGTGKRPPRGIRSTWLAGHDELGFATISRFRNRARDETDDVLTRSVLMSADKGFVSPDVENAGGTKMESKASRCAFVWRKAAERNRVKPVVGKMVAPPSRTDDAIARDDASGNERVEFTPVCRRVLLKNRDSRPDSHLVQKTRGGRDDAVGGRSGRGGLGAA